MSGALQHLRQASQTGPNAQPLPIIGQDACQLAAISGRSGRGPIRLISPIRTLTSWGSSLTWLARRNLPTGVTRRSPGRHQTGPDSRSLSWYMVRTL